MTDNNETSAYLDAVCEVKRTWTGATPDHNDPWNYEAANDLRTQFHVLRRRDVAAPDVKNHGEYLEGFIELNGHVTRYATNAHPPEVLRQNALALLELAEAFENTPRRRKLRTGEPGTFAHCGDQYEHDAHWHEGIGHFGTGTPKDKHCLGTRVTDETAEELIPIEPLDFYSEKPTVTDQELKEKLGRPRPPYDLRYHGEGRGLDFPKPPYEPWDRA